MPVERPLGRLRARGLLGLVGFRVRSPKTVFVRCRGKPRMHCCYYPYDSMTHNSSNEGSSKCAVDPLQSRLDDVHVRLGTSEAKTIKEV